MAAVAPPSEKAPLFYAFTAFCLAISVACVAPGRIAQFFGSVVASGILVVGLLYVASMVAGGPIFTGRRSDESLFNSLVFIGFYGLPSAAYLWRARFGFATRSRCAAEPEESGGET